MFSTMITSSISYKNYNVASCCCIIGYYIYIASYQHHLPCMGSCIYVVIVTMTLMSLFYYFLLMDFIAGTQSGSLPNYIAAS